MAAFFMRINQRLSFFGLFCNQIMKGAFYFFITSISSIVSFSAYANNLQNTPIDTNWNQLPVILSRIHAPVFPNKDFNIVSFGAPTNGTTISTAYIQKAIDSCSSVGGGRVVVPAGTFLTGAITLKSNVNLHISAGATLKFSTNTADYLPVVYTRFEGIECYNYSPFIYSYGAQNIALTGSGTINGQASNNNWWAWANSPQFVKDDTLLNQEGQEGTPVDERIFGSGHQLRPVFVQFYNSQNILIDSITVINSPMWELNPVLSQNITIQNVNINSLGPNNDGCDPECCSDVLIYNCTFNTGDDCIAVKSGRNNDGRRVNVPSQYVVIQNCNMQDGHGGVTLGSECSGGINNVFAENCSLNSPNLNSILRFKTNSVRGGIIANIFMRNCTIGKVAGDILDVDMYYDEGDVGTFTPVIQNIEIDSCNSSSSEEAWEVDAYERSPLTDVKIIGCNFNNSTTTGTLTNVSRLQVYNSFINGSVPLIPAPINGYTEAEAYSNKLSWGWSNVTGGFDGNGYMEFADSMNYIEWNINKLQNEVDTIIIRYANTDMVNKPCTLLVNGTNAGQILFSPTQSNWLFAKQVINLYKGNNTIRLVSLSNKPGAYVDRFNISTSPALFVQTDTATLCPGDAAFFVSGYDSGYNWQWQLNTDSGYININNDSIYSGANADTLYLNNAPSVLYGNQYRCVITNATDTFYSKEYIIKFAATWTGSIDTSWENAANWSCGNVPDSNTDVIINSGSPYYPVVNATTSCRSVNVVAPATVTLNTGVTLTLTGKAE
jgi:polygalacturonase